MLVHSAAAPEAGRSGRTVISLALCPNRGHFAYRYRRSEAGIGALAAPDASFGSRRAFDPNLATVATGRLLRCLRWRCLACSVVVAVTGPRRPNSRRGWRRRGMREQSRSWRNTTRTATKMPRPRFSTPRPVASRRSIRTTLSRHNSRRLYSQDASGIANLQPVRRMASVLSH